VRSPYLWPSLQDRRHHLSAISSPALLDHVATFAAPVFVCGDFNVRFDRPDYQCAVRLHSLLTCHGLLLRSTGPTHVRGGTLDAVAANAVYDINATVTDVAISDHTAI
jgi:hypothetical protein